MPNSADPTSDEVNGFMLLASAMTANTEESRITRVENRNWFRWFIILFAVFHAIESMLIVFYLPSRIGGIGVNQNQNISIEPDSNSIGKMTRDVLEGRTVKTKRIEQ